MRTKMFRPFGFYFTTAVLAAACSCDPRLTCGQRLAVLVSAWWIPAVHELGHATLALLLRMPVLKCWAVPGLGRTRVVTRGRQFEFGLVALAGPLAGIGGALVVRAFAHGTGPADGISPLCQQWLSCIALAGLLESAANLTPFSPLLDGAKAWKALRGEQVARRLVRRLTAHFAREWDRPVRAALAPAPVPAAASPAAAPVARATTPAARVRWCVVRGTERTAWCERIIRGHDGRRSRARVRAAA
jgi:hypothetical protein